MPAERLSYSARAPPTRRAALRRYQRVRAGGGAGVPEGGEPADFDLDPAPDYGCHKSTWNPGVLFARSTRGARALVQAWVHSSPNPNLNPDPSRKPNPDPHPNPNPHPNPHPHPEPEPHPHPHPHPNTEPGP